jgi:hypothetical protein
MKMLFVFVIGLIAAAGMSTSFAGECRSSLSWSQNGRLLADAFLKFRNGDSIEFNSDGSANVYDKYGEFRFVIESADLEIQTDIVGIDVSDYIAGRPPRGDGLDLLRFTLRDTEDLVKAAVAKCGNEETGIWCRVGNYYCACYYGDPDGTGGDCHCGKVDNSEDQACINGVG